MWSVSGPVHAVRCSQASEVKYCSLVRLTLSRSLCTRGSGKLFILQIIHFTNYSNYSSHTSNFPTLGHNSVLSQKLKKVKWIQMEKSYYS